MDIRRLSSLDASFNDQLKQLLAFETVQDDEIDLVVANILRDVKQRGDEAVLQYTQRFDRLKVNSLSELELSQTELQSALDSLPAEQRTVLQQAADRVRNYHEKQLMSSWEYTENDGTLLGQQVTSGSCRTVCTGR